MRDTATPYTVPADFTPGGGTIVLPSGKIIYAAEPGIYNVSLTQLSAVTWNHYDPATGTAGAPQTIPAGTVTPPITNSYISSDGNAYVEYDLSDGTTMNALLNRTNFDAAVLEALPSKTQMDSTAAAQSNNANAATAAANGNFFDKFFYGLFGVSTTTGLVYTGIGLLGFSYIRRKFAK